MSYDQIVELLTYAAESETAALSETAAATVATLHRYALRRRSEANDIAAATQPGVVHPDHGYGAIVGVTKDGELEVAFGGEPFAVAMPADQVREARW